MHQVTESFRSGHYRINQIKKQLTFSQEVEIVGIFKETNNSFDLGVLKTIDDSNYAKDGEDPVLSNWPFLQDNT